MARNILVVGAPGSHSFRYGSVYVYEKNDADKSWKIQQKIESTLENALYGIKVAISKDASTFAVSASSANTVFIYERDSVGTWVEKKKIDDRPGMLLGLYGLHFSPDNLFVVQSSAGLYLYKKGTSGTWDLLDTQPPFSLGDFAISKKFFAIAERGPNGTFTLAVKERTQNLGEWPSMQSNVQFEFGVTPHTVAMSGNTIAVGVPQDLNSNGEKTGTVHIVNKKGSTWERTQIIEAGDGQDADMFGISVAFAGDLLVVGDFYNKKVADYAGAVYVFSLNAAKEWVELEKIVAKDASSHAVFGSSISTFGRTVAVGAKNEGLSFQNTAKGAVYVLELHCDN